MGKAAEAVQVGTPSALLAECGRLRQRVSSLERELAIREKQVPREESIDKQESLSMLGEVVRDDRQDQNSHG